MRSRLSGVGAWLLFAGSLAGMAFWASATYDDALRNGATVRSLALWIILGVLIAALVGAIEVLQAIRWKRPHHGTSRFFRVVTRLVRWVGGATLLTASVMNHSHGAWRLAVLAGVGGLLLVWPVMLIAASDR